MPPRTLDARDLFCPEPLMRTQQEALLLESGGLLEVWVRSPAAVEDILSWASRSGHHATVRETQAGWQRILLQKNGF